MRLRNKILFFVAAATGVTSMSLAVSIMAANYSSDVTAIEKSISNLVSRVKNSGEDKLSSAILYAEGRNISLGYIQADGKLTVLQNSGGPLSSKFQIKKILRIGSKERLVFSRSTKELSDNFQNLLLPVIALSLFSSLVSILLTYLLMRRDIWSLQSLTRQAGEVEAGESSNISVTKGSDEIVYLSRSIESMLDKLNRSKAELEIFIADTSHELRTPLTVIRGYLELLKNRKNVPEEQLARAIDRAHSEALRMQNLINDILFMAEVGESDLNKSDEIYFRKVIEKHLPDFFPLSGSRNVNLVVEQTNPYLGSQDKLSQFFINAFANICAHTPETTSVEISIREEVGNFFIEIADSGPGLPENFHFELDSSFKRFNQAKSAVTGGSGLGLSIMSRIIQAHEGKMQLGRSQLGGLKILVALPII